MKRTVDVRHFSRVSILGLLLTSTFALALADDPNYSKLTYGDGKEYQTTLFRRPSSRGTASTAEQSKLIHGLSWDTECKDSGWWEYQEKFRHDAEAWAKAHPDDSNQTNLPASKQSPAPDR